MFEVISVNHLAQRIMNRFKIQHQCALHFDDCFILVRSNSKPLIQRIQKYYHAFVVEKYVLPVMEIIVCEGKPLSLKTSLHIKTPDLGKTKIKEEFVDLSDGRLVRKILTGMEFLFNKDISLAVGACLKHSNQVVNFINNRYIQRRLNSGCCLLHASAIEQNNQGVALCGFSGAGKSTLALHLMSQGVNFVSNDRLMISKYQDGLKMFGVAKLPRVNPGTLLNNKDLATVMPKTDRKKFAHLPTEELWNLEHKYDVSVADIFGSERFKLSSPMKMLVILNWKRGWKIFQAKRVNLKNREDLWPAFMKDAGLFYQPDHASYFSKFATSQAYLNHLKQCTVYEFSGAVDFEQAVDFILKKLKPRT